MFLKKVSSISVNFQLKYFSHEKNPLSFSSARRLQYLRQLCAAVSVHTWLIESHFISISQLFGPEQTSKHRSKKKSEPVAVSQPLEIVPLMASFLDYHAKLSDSPAASDARLVATTADSLVVVFSLISTMLERKVDPSILAPLFSGKLFEILFNCVLCPAAVLGDMYTVGDVTASMTTAKNLQTSKEKSQKKGADQQEDENSPLSSGTMRLIHALFRGLKKSSLQGFFFHGIFFFFFELTQTWNDTDTYMAMKKSLAKYLRSAESSLLSLELQRHGQVSISLVSNLNFHEVDAHLFFFLCRWMSAKFYIWCADTNNFFTQD